ncbi:MAG: glycine zipper 2TM domain-containing protein [Hyphomonadaceae bacterium]|nr:glycine zipper 2TM domain-containing protein [Hyphomonadaceae bacterium]
MRIKAFVAAAALMAGMMAAPQQAAAQSYPSYGDAHAAQQYQCQTSRNNRTMGGAAIGAVAGAVLGSQVSGRGHRTDGSVLGAVVGAVAGGMIGRQTAQPTCNLPPQGSYEPYYGQPYQQPYGDNSGLYGGPYQNSSYGYGDSYQDCRMGERIVRDPYGREYREPVRMCRSPDGSWYPQG